MSLDYMPTDLEEVTMEENLDDIGSSLSPPLGDIEDTRNEALANVEILVLSIILFLAVVGNGLMLIALRRQLKFRPMSRMYYFMLNLSVADLLVAFCNILPQLAWDITFRFKGSDFLCRLIKFLQIFVLYLSTYILTSMTLDRYLVVCHHSFSRNHYGGLKSPKVMVAISWILSLIFASPQAVIFSQSEIRPGVFDCWTFLGPSGVKAYVTWFVISVFLLPLLICGISYGAICFKVVSFSLHESNNRKLNEVSRYSKNSRSVSSSPETQSEVVIEEAPTPKDVGSRRLAQQISEVKIKTLKLTLVVVLCFFVCWSPFCVTQLILVYNPTLPVGPGNVILLLLPSLNSCTNPWIYLAFSESLCNQLRVFLGIGLRRGSSGESIGAEQDIILRTKKFTKPRPDTRPHQDKSRTMKQVSTLDAIENQGAFQLQLETKSEVL